VLTCALPFSGDHRLWVARAKDSARGAVAELRWARETGHARAALSLEGYALARSGRTAEARAILSDLLAGRAYSHGAFGIAVVCAGLRDYDQAFAALEKAEQEGSTRVYLMDPLFEDLQGDPRFDNLMGARATVSRGSQNR
jgi:hypothetical protein